MEMLSLHDPTARIPKTEDLVRNKHKSTITPFQHRFPRLRHQSQHRTYWDTLKETVYRRLIPKSRKKRKKERRGFAWFIYIYYRVLVCVCVCVAEDRCKCFYRGRFAASYRLRSSCHILRHIFTSWISSFLGRDVQMMLCHINKWTRVTECNGGGERRSERRWEVCWGGWKVGVIPVWSLPLSDESRLWSNLLQVLIL